MKGAVLGVGRMGRRHVEMMQKLGMDIVGVSDPRQESLDLAASENGIPTDRQYSSPARLLDEGRPEFVVVASTADAHCELTCLAAEMGARYVLCEKPMACSIDECRSMIAACRSTGARLAINHPMRFMAYYTAPKAIVNSCEFGGLTSMTVVGGNFGVAMNGTHFVEAFRYLTEEDPEEVTAWFDSDKVPNPRGEQFEDASGSIRVTTKSGCKLYLECGARQGHGINVILAGPYGQIAIDQLTGTMSVTFRNEEHRNLPSTRYGMPFVESQTRLDPPNMVDLCTSMAVSLIEGMSYATGEDGMMALSTLVAAYVSNESGHTAVSIRSSELPGSRRFPWA